MFALLRDDPRIFTVISVFRMKRFLVALLLVVVSCTLSSAMVRIELFLRARCPSTFNSIAIELNLKYGRHI